MAQRLTHFVRKALQRFGLEIWRAPPKRGIKVYSHLDEQTIIREYLKALGSGKAGCCVDIAAHDGMFMSNTYSLYADGWKGLAVEFDAKRFSYLARNYWELPHVGLAKCKVTPQNILPLLHAYEIPQQFDFLSLDIDGYDFYILEQLFSQFRPKLVCAEINENIPPPIKFSVRFDPSFAWAEDLTDHFHGQSISQLYLLATKCRYALVELHYNNAFLVPSEYSWKRPLSPEEAYQMGYKEKSDRKEKFPWNADIEEGLHMPPLEALDFIHKRFEKYQGKYDASIER